MSKIGKIVFAAAATATVVAVANAADFGQKVEALAKSQSLSLFGVSGTLGNSSSIQRTTAELNADPTSAITVAPGLSVRVVSAAANLGFSIDQMVLWPDSTNPTHIIACNEQSASEVAVQRIDLATGVAQNIISLGMGTCDPVRKTPWGTIIAGEETGGGGRLFEILDPQTTSNVTISGSGLATTSSDTAHVRFVSAVGTLSWEGLALLPNGVLYSTDESRPGNGIAGGSVFKFIPTNLWTGGAPITDLANSPLTAGRIFGLRVGRNSSNTDYAWGNEYGRGVWVEITGRSDVGSAPINLRNAALTLKLTGYYRPEDAEFDGKEFALGNVRFCGTNTGQDTADTTSNGDNHWGEVYCLRDGTFAAAAATTTTVQTVSGVNYTLLTGTAPEYQALVLGSKDFAMMDNIAYHPTRGFWVLNEDGDGATWTPKRNNDIWACLDDGADADKLTDACVKLMTLNDLTAETTGGVFDATGTRYFVSVQHPNTNHGIILEVNGWLP